MGKISVREWIQKFNNGEFEAKDFNTQVKAGWYDWFCSDSALSNRLKKMGNIIKDIKNDFVLDNYYVWFKNNCPMTGKLYDDFRFEPFNEELRNKNYFGVTCEDQRNEHKYEIFTGRNDYTTEFTAGNKKELLSIINKLGTELSRN
jgi:hypothetical protein